MSHASIIVALSRENLEAVGGNVEAAVEFQMLPFSEKGEWFADGSRWDWWQIGGRFTGKFKVGSNPSGDPRNQETCFCCGGTGRRDDAVGQEARKRYPDYTCNGCHGKGKSTKHPGLWVNDDDSGNIAERADLDESALTEARKVQAARNYDDWAAEEGPPNGFRRLGYGVEADETKEAYVSRRSSFPISASAFLRDRQWHEGGRMGWFGDTIKTECEIKAAKSGEEFTGRCIHTHEESGAKIVDWTGPKDSDEKWEQLYWARFIRNLPPDTTLVCVDFHV